MKVLPSRKGLISLAPRTIELIALGFLLFAAWQARSSSPSLPLSDYDTWGYLNPALSWLGGLGFQQTYGRDWLYPALLAFFLKAGGSFSGIFFWQQTLGLLAVLLMAAAWRIWVSFFPVSPWIRLLLVLAGFLPIWMQATNPQLIFFEFLIRPEAVMPFFVYAQLACLLAYCRYRWLFPHGTRALIFAAAAVFLAGVCLLLKPSWLLACVSTVAPVFVGCLGSAISLRARLFGPLLGLGLGVLFLWLPARVWFIKDATSRTFLPATLFTIHARLIEKDLHVRMASLPEADPEKKKLHILLASLTAEIHEAEIVSHSYEKLGFDADYLYYRSPLMDSLNAYAGNTPETFRSFCLQAYRDVILHDPGGFAHKVSTQFSHFLFPEPATFYKARIDLKKALITADDALKLKTAHLCSPGIRGMFQNYLADLGELAKNPPVLERRNFARDLSKRISACALPLELLFLAALVAALIGPPLAGLRLGGWGALLLFLAPAANAFTVSLVHALDISRYRYSYGGFLLFALTAMAVFILVVLAFSLRVLVEKFRTRRSWRL